MQVVRANMDSPTVAAATEGGSPFYKIYEIYLVRWEKPFRSTYLWEEFVGNRGARLWGCREPLLHNQAWEYCFVQV